jgi:hypothetical protein
LLPPILATPRTVGLQAATFFYIIPSSLLSACYFTCLTTLLLF